jgi:uncharacterized protein
MTKMFYDTYAVIENIKGNPGILQYGDFAVVLTKLNLFEIYYWVLRTQNAKQAAYFLQKYSAFAADYDESVIAEAAQLKLRDKQLSMADCIGYTVARQLGIKFLTGDKAFAKLPQLEFVR